MTPVVYDAGPLIAADRNDRAFWAEHLLRVAAGVVPLVPAPVVAQVSRSSRQAQLRRLLRACDVVPFDEDAAHRAGALLGRSSTSDLVDAAVVLLAVDRGADIVSGDPGDIQRLVARVKRRPRIVPV